MSSIRIVENVTSSVGGRQVPVLEFVRQYKPLAAAISKATPGVDRVTRDAAGNRKLSAIDFASLANIHRTLSRRNKDAKMTLQMLPDLKLAIEMIISLIMSPKDMFSDEVTLYSDISSLLPASIVQALQQVTNEYYRKNHNLSEFLQNMLMEVFANQGAYPVAVIPENALDDLVNNYNNNITLESFRKEFDVDKNVAHPIGLLGVPDYLNPQKNNTPIRSGKLKFGSSVTFDLENFNKNSMNVRADSSTSGIAFSKLVPSAKTEAWTFKAFGDNKDVNADELMVVTDNIAALKLPSYRERSLESRVGSVINSKGLNKLSVSMESAKSALLEKWNLKKAAGGNVGEGQRRLSDAEVESLIYKNRRFAHTPVATLRNNTALKRNSIGEAMIKVFDTAGFMPLSIEGDPTRKLGGYVLLDEEGYPITSNTPGPDEIMNLSEMAGATGNFVSTMNERSNNVLNGKDCSTVPTYMLRRFMTRSFAEMVDKDLIDRVKNGQYDNGIQLGDNEDFYWLMLTRCMRGQRTQLLWIPAEFLVYFAMDYDELGFGKSLLDDIRNITSMRIMLMVSGIAASLRNSIGRTKVSIKLDEEDQDAERTVEDIQDEILKSRMNPIPFGINNVADISKYLQRACYEFEITGSSALPDMQVSFDQYNSTYPKPDEELQTQLKDLSIEHVGITSSMIDASREMSFAVQAATENLLTMKRVQRWQRKVIPQATDYVRKISANSEEQITAYREILTNNFDQMQIEKLKKHFEIDDETLFQNDDFKKLVVEQCINEYINALFVDLPSPGASTLESQRASFDAAVDFYRAAIDFEFNEAYFDSALQGEQMQGHVDAMKNLILAHYMRKWRADNNVLPELSELTTIGEDGKVGVNIMDSLEVHVKALGMSTGGFFRRFKKFAELQTSLMESVDESNTSGDTSPDASSTGGDGGGDGGDAGGDFDSLDDFPELPEDGAPEDGSGGPADETPPEETPPE